MARTGSYKTYERNTRNYTLENTFTRGMKYSNAPISEGEVRILNNFDLSNDRMTLQPRKGLRLDTTVMPSAFEINDDRVKLKYFNSSETANRALVEDSDGDLYFTIQDATTTRKSLKMANNHQGYQADFVHDIPMDTEYNSRVRSASACAYNFNYYIPKAKSGTDPYGFYVCKDDIDAHTLDGSGRYIPEILTPRVLNAAEATVYGYNMLLDAPYSFNDTALAVGDPSIILDGILPYKPSPVDASGNPTVINFDPRINERVTFRAYYEATPGTGASQQYYAIWNTRTNADDNYIYKKVQMFTVTSNTAPALKYTDSVPNSTLFINLMVWACEATNLTTAEALKTYYTTGGRSPQTSTIYYNSSTSQTWYWSTVDQEFIGCDPATILNDVPVLQSIENSFDFSATNNSSIRGMKFENYDLSTSLGMVSWAGSLVCYAPNNGRNVLFMSAYNEPEYFPYPLNTDIFEEDIRYCTPYLDNLLVFTETQLWQLTKDLTSTGWTKSLVQGNLNISDFDINFIQVVKNMVYFKSSDNYFMVVPKASSSTGELTLAPVSRSLDEFFHNFKASVLDVITNTYGEYENKNNQYRFTDAEITMLDAFSYLDYEDIHNIYKLRLKWYNSESVVIETQDLTIELLYNTVARYWRTYTYQTNYTLYPYTADATQATDLMILVPSASHLYSLQIVKRSENREDNLPNSYHKNYQLVDSGYHDYTLESKKRFRELQFFINNLSHEDLTFGLGFVLDNISRIPLFNYTITQQQQNDTNVVWLDRDLKCTETVPGAIVSNLWHLQQTITDISLWKIRTVISGKGYAPRFKFISQNEKHFEFVSFTWVYRMLYLR